jgi:hypothetical protein
LTTGRTDPPQDQRVHSVGTDSEDDHREVLDARVCHESTEDEAENGNRLRSSDVPSTFIHLARRPRDQKCRGTGDEVRWAGQNKSDGPVEAKSLDDRRELEGMLVNHEGQYAK